MQLFRIAGRKRIDDYGTGSELHQSSTPSTTISPWRVLAYDPVFTTKYSTTSTQTTGTEIVTLACRSEADLACRQAHGPQPRHVPLRPASGRHAKMCPASNAKCSVPSGKDPAPHMSGRSIGEPLPVLALVSCGCRDLTEPALRHTATDCHLCRVRWCVSMSSSHVIAPRQR